MKNVNVWLQSTIHSDHKDHSDEIVAQIINDRSTPGFCQDDNPVDETIRSGAKNKKRSFVERDLHFDIMYFNVNFIYDNVDFERRFRMPRVIFKRMLEGIHVRGLFVQRYDAANWRGISPLILLIAALHMLVYGKSYDQVDELVSASSSSFPESFLSFTKKL